IYSIPARLSVVRAGIELRDHFFCLGTIYSIPARLNVVRAGIELRDHFFCLGTIYSIPARLNVVRAGIELRDQQFTEISLVQTAKTPKICAKVRIFSFL
ncbi:MAG: hypothetical protein K9J84_08720, partial [Bacteroidia bacterium]|nr:hypothetical protein [Bacteroidia bacterium]